MTKTDGEARYVLPAGARAGIIAGGGALPLTIAKALKEQGADPFVLILAGEAEPGSLLESCDHETRPLEDIGKLVAILKRHRVTHLVMAGEIRRRPKLSALRPSLSLLAWLPTVIAGLAQGDDGLLRLVMRRLETNGIHVVGAHEIVPELLATEGAWTKTTPKPKDWRDVAAARAAAEAIGALDIGQGAVAIGGRAIALEGIEGTNGLLERVRDLRGHGRLAGKTGGVLVKCLKPGQELRADLPTVGPTTIELAHAAGLSGIAVEAGRSLVMDGPGLVARADALGLFALGLPAREGGDGD
ncbi:MAG: UDP-2,3-diacylglucosamine diphosphatase LpxI [Mesorhizobium sp.]|nr:UDP-2,3-diacylglucosamine diphosphatase LpxI [Mesorhizobium sp.]MBN9245447.1 UDP-2,3-diacylglucosamine diphosphatase LpxI [Mesorhizobium sp.]